MNWTPSERAFLIANYKTMTQKDMAKALGRGHATIHVWMDMLGLERKQREAPPKYEPKCKPLEWSKGKHLQEIWR